MSSQSEQLTAAEISRLAGVTRATVSNWRRRHSDFPQPSGGTEGSPTYDRRQIEKWLDARGRLPARSPRDDLRAGLRGRPSRDGEAVALFAAHLAGLDERKRAGVAALTDGELGKLCEDASGRSDVPPSLLRSAAEVTVREGAFAALTVVEELSEAPVGVRGLHGTPAGVAETMAGLAVSGGRARSVLDPACGGGRLLAAAAARLAPGADVHGQEFRPVAAAQAEARIREEAPGVSVTVRVGDSLRDDAFPDLRVDAVVCNPPYGDRDWGHDELALDERWAYGVPPRGEPEMVWVQHALAHLNEGGHAVLLLPPATASRSSGRRIRKELLRRGAVRAVIALPPGLAVPFHIGLHLWVLRRPEDDRPATDLVLLMDTTDEVSADAQESKPDEGALRETILRTWEAFAADPEGFDPVPGRAQTVPAIDLLDDLIDLTPARHVRSAPAIEPDAAARHLADVTRLLAAEVAALAESAKLGTWEPAGHANRTWRTATVADLVRGRAVALHRGVRGSSDEPTPAELLKRRILRARDLIAGAEAGGDPREIPLAEPTIVQGGDVLLAQAVTPQGVAARVAGEQDAGCLLGSHVYLLRPDPERLDSWFLAGFVSAADNVAQATTGTSSHTLVASRLRVPLLPLPEQRTYGRAFRIVHDLRSAARTTAARAAEAADLLTTGLTSGALLPPERESPE
ncbi:N-6 DNA methylase [Spirillospora sp. NPDC052242]